MSNADLVWLDCGIYLIRNRVDLRVYVGSAKDIARRWRQHTIALNRGNHPSKHLQAAWTKYGAASFEFVRLEKLFDLRDLIRREQFWIDQFQSQDRERGYNLSPKAGSQLGYRFSEESLAKLRASHLGKRQPCKDETKQKIAAALRGHPCYKDPNRKKGGPIRGTVKRPHSIITRQRISEAARARSRKNARQFRFDFS
jgi:group I intron endonuclease